VTAAVLVGAQLGSLWLMGVARVRAFPSRVVSWPQ
jgi:hypothetical protein